MRGREREREHTQRKGEREREDTNRERGRERERDTTQRERERRERHTQRERERDKHTKIEGERKRDTHTKIEGERERERSRVWERDIHTHTHTHTERERDASLVLVVFRVMQACSNQIRAWNTVSRSNVAFLLLPVYSLYLYLFSNAHFLMCLCHFIFLNTLQF